MTMHQLRIKVMIQR